MATTSAGNDVQSTRRDREQTYPIPGYYGSRGGGRGAPPPPGCAPWQIFLFLASTALIVIGGLIGTITAEPEPEKPCVAEALS